MTAPDGRRSLPLRLTLWYAGIFALTSSLAFAVIYLLMVHVVQQRTDDDLRGDIEDFAALAEDGGVAGVVEGIALEAAGDEAESVFFRLWDARGDLVASSDLGTWPELAPPDRDRLRAASGEAPRYATVEANSRREHAVRVASASIGNGLVLEIGQSLEEDDDFIATFLQGFLLVLLSILLLGGPVGWFLARRALAPVGEVTRAAAEIAAGAHGRRVAVPGRDDELALLGRTINTMLDRIEQLIAGMHEMTDNLAHDLRSPLARIRGAAEMSLADDASPEGQAAAAVEILEGCDRLLELIDTSLDIAEAQSGAARFRYEEVELAEIVAAAVELFQTVAEDLGIALSARIDAPGRVRGDRHCLQRTVANLLDNALKYTPEGGRVEVLLHEEADTVSLEFVDTGIGIPADQLPRVFDRYYRCDPSRSRDGNGLGLSLARAFVTAHGGKITAASRPGEGSRFRVRLPAAAHAAPGVSGREADRARPDGDRPAPAFTVTRDPG